MKLEVRLEGETLWLSQQHMAELFQSSQQNVSHYIGTIYEDDELDPAATHKKFLLVRREGNRDISREIEYYNLDMILSVGYRVKSAVATRFHIWATPKLREFVVKGFVLDDERLKNPDLPFDYFEELLDGFRISAQSSPVIAGLSLCSPSSSSDSSLVSARGFCSSSTRARSHSLTVPRF